MGVWLLGCGLPVVAVSIQVDYNQLLRRITGRRNCPVCQSIYNVYGKPPPKEGFCDVDGAALAQRADDTEKVFEERMRAYEASTAPVVEHYRARDALRKWMETGRFGRLRPELLPPSSGCAIAQPRRVCA